MSSRPGSGSHPDSPGHRGCHRRPGYLVAVCGIDGSGKSTQIASVVEHLGRRGPVVSTRQPTDLYRQDPLVRSMLDLDVEDREIAVPELALFAAFDRVRHVRTTVLPALRVGSAVVSDRYVYSTYAYFLARGIVDIDWLVAVNRHAPEPDLVVYLDVEPAVAARRIIARDGNSSKREELDLDRMAAVRCAFLDQPWGSSERYHVVDGAQPLAAVTAEVRALVDACDPRPTARGPLPAGAAAAHAPVGG